MRLIYYSSIIRIILESVDRFFFPKKVNMLFSFSEMQNISWSPTMQLKLPIFFYFVTEILNNTENALSIMTSYA